MAAWALAPTNTQPAIWPLSFSRCGTPESSTIEYWGGDDWALAGVVAAARASTDRASAESERPRPPTTRSIWTLLPSPDWLRGGARCRPDSLLPGRQSRWSFLPHQYRK